MTPFRSCFILYKIIENATKYSTNNELVSKSLERLIIVVLVDLFTCR